MATSGFLKKNITSDGSIFLQLNWTAGEQNVAENYTPVTWEYKLASTNANATISSADLKKINVTLDGENVASKNVNITLGGGGIKTLASGTKNIVHNVDGSKTFTINYSQQIDTTIKGTKYGTITASGTGVLDDISRATTPTVTGTKSLGSTITINTPKVSSGFTHKLYYSWGKNIIDEEIATGVSTSTTFTIPKTLANDIPYSTAGTMYIKCETYNGSNLVGTRTITISVSVPNTTEFKPKVNSVTLTEANSSVPSTWGVFVQGVSELNGKVNTTSAYSSPINTYKVSINGNTYTSETFKTEVLAVSGTNNISVTVTDRRGRSTTYTTTFNVIEYGKPYINSFNVNRLTATTASLKINGGVYAVNNKNTYTYQYKYKLKTDDTYTTVTISNAAYTIDKTITVSNLEDATYDFIGVISDSINTGDKATVKLSILPTTSKIVNVKSDGKGIGLFKKSEKDGLEVNGNIYDKFGTLINNGFAVYESSGSTDVNNTLEELVLSTVNTPDNGFWYVKTMFFSNKSITASRTQIAYPYNKKSPTYCRYYINGTGWSEWFVSDVIKFVYTDNSGHIHFGNGLLIQWGRVVITPTGANAVTSIKVNFPLSYDNAPLISAVPQIAYPNAVTCSIGGGSTIEEAKNSMIIYMTRTNASATNFQWMAIGVKGGQ